MCYKNKRIFINHLALNNEMKMERMTNWPFQNMVGFLLILNKHFEIHVVKDVKSKFHHLLYY